MKQGNVEGVPTDQHESASADVVQEGSSLYEGEAGKCLASRNCTRVTRIISSKNLAREPSVNKQFRLKMQ